MDSDILQRVFDVFMVRPLEPFCQLCQIDGCVALSRHQDDVVAGAFETVPPQRPIRKDLHESGDLALRRLHAAFVKRDPEPNGPAGFQMLFGQIEIFIGVERGGAFDPGMDGVVRDHVELFHAWCA